MAEVTRGLQDPNKINIHGFPGTFTVGDQCNPKLVVIRYGGTPGEGRPGHGRIVSNDGIHVHKWERPACEDSKVEIDDEFSTYPLRSFAY